MEYTVPIIELIVGLVRKGIAPEDDDLTALEDELRRELNR